MTVINVSYTGPDGSFWGLDGERRNREIMLVGVEGLTAEVERAVSPRPNGVGVDVNASTYPSLEGTLSFIAYADDVARKGEVFRLFSNAWRTGAPGKLTVVNSVSGTYSIAAYARKTLDVTSFSPWSWDVAFVEFAVPVFSTDGVWEGEVREWSGSNLSIPNRGDLPLYPVIKWSGSNQKVTLPSGVVVNLPSTPAGIDYFLSMDPAVSFRVTNSVGVPVDAWSAMRGFPVYGTIPAGSSAVFATTSGATIQTRELIENPWR